MLSILKPKEGEPPKRTDPHDIILIANSDSAQPTLAPAPEAPEAPHIVVDTAPRPEPEHAASRPIPPIEPTFRPSAIAAGDNLAIDPMPVRGPLASERRPLRAIGRFLFAVLLGGGAMLAWQSYGDAGKLMLAHWAPQLAPLLTPRSNAPAQPSPATPEAATANPAPPAAAPSAQPVAPATAAAPSAETTQSLQSINQALTAMARDIEQLKAGQEQLKASQEQLARDVAKLAVQRKPPAPPPRPTTAAPPPAHKPAPLPPPPAAAAQPRPLAPPAPIRSAPSMPPPPGSSLTPPRPMP
jgi:hypothetical protein